MLITAILNEIYDNPSAEKVVYSIYKKSPQSMTFSEIKTNSDTSITDDKKIMEFINVAIKKGILKCEKEIKGAMKYSFDTQECINRVHHPAFALYVRQHIGEEPYCVVKHILDEGIFFDKANIEEKKIIEQEDAEKILSQLLKLNIIQGVVQQSTTEESSKEEKKIKSGRKNTKKTSPKDVKQESMQDFENSESNFNKLCK